MYLSVCVHMRVCEYASVPSRAARVSSRVSGQGAACAPWALVHLPGAWEVARKAGHSPLLPAQVPLKVSLSAGRSWGYLVPLQGAPGPTNVPPSLQATSGPPPAPERQPPRLHFCLHSVRSPRQQRKREPASTRGGAASPRPGLHERAQPPSPGAACSKRLWRAVMTCLCDSFPGVGNRARSP